MKAMDVSSLSSGERVELLKELQRLAQLRHPHLCGLKEVFLHQGKLCSVMDYLPGGNLAAQVASKGPIDAMRTLLWFTQALLAVDYLHRCDVLHRDLRLRRLLLTRHGLVVVTGVALSTTLKRLVERPGNEALRYLAPEILLQHEEHSSASDMWALGVILYELLTAQSPWPTDLPRLREALQRPLRPLPARHAELAPLCYSLLKRRPEQRWTATELLRQQPVQSRLVELLKLDDEIVTSRRGSLPSTAQCWNSGVEKFPALGHKTSAVKGTKVQGTLPAALPSGFLSSRWAKHVEMGQTF